MPTGPVFYTSYRGQEVACRTLATARALDATFWTQDADFEQVPGVRYVARKRQA
ncbi:MAG TPA: hypothetical protein VLT86_11470 [Vicinamibacterales bacterium]|nr:hypothetical protein [Vicinamibacterales bacterium]